VLEGVVRRKGINSVGGVVGVILRSLSSVQKVSERTTGLKREEAPCFHCATIDRYRHRPKTRHPQIQSVLLADQSSVIAQEPSSNDHSEGLRLPTR
jgi:hypothetical protein